uniref:Uncharacterized protein n=1 Tax=Stegastes partitus TaxID=144197 RepID=A0A3B5BLB6_9TELE
MTVFALPPRESWSSRVSLESLYGTWVLFPSTRAEMTFPRAERDRLILAASFRRFPLAPVLLWRSLPARSTMFSFPTRMWSSPSGPTSLHSTVMTKMAWERELRSFMLVKPTDLDWLPMFITCSISVAFLVTTEDRSFT